MAKSSALMRSFNRLRSLKKSFCQGKIPKAAVKAAAKQYVTAARKAGQTQTEANKKARRVLSKGCSMSSYIAKKGKTPNQSTKRRAKR